MPESVEADVLTVEPLLVGGGVVVGGEELGVGEAGDGVGDGCGVGFVLGVGAVGGVGVEGGLLGVDGGGAEGGVGPVGLSGRSGGCVGSAGSAPAQAGSGVAGVLGEGFVGSAGVLGVGGMHAVGSGVGVCPTTTAAKRRLATITVTGRKRRAIMSLGGRLGYLYISSLMRPLTVAVSPRRVNRGGRSPRETRRQRARGR